MAKSIRVSSFVIISLIILFSLYSSSSSYYPSAANSSNFTSANSAINSAFSATRGAEQSGGNVSALIAKLNVALSLVQKAQSENASNPTQASLDLQNATQIADQVSTSAPSVARAGSAARETQYAESIGSSIAIVILALLVYLYGARVYHLVWFYLYKNHLVKKGGVETG